jgi:fermentation-respiration switch protein FrsA (DUF1100 family)
MNSFISALMLVLAAYLVMLALLYFGQSRMIFFPELPSRALVASPADIGLDYDPVSLRTIDGVELDGWFVPAPGRRRGTLLFLHGNAGNISHRLDSLRIFHDLGLDTLIFDYRGYGRSSGRPSEQGTYRDAMAAWRYLVRTRGIPEEQIVLFGRSLGAAIAAELATRVRPAGLILESSFSSVPEFAAQAYPFFPARWLARYDYATADYVARVVCPVLVVHSRDDEIIPFKYGNAVFQRARPPKHFLEIRGGHNDGFLLSGERYVRGLQAFMRGVLSPPVPDQD